MVRIVHGMKSPITIDCLNEVRTNNVVGSYNRSDLFLHYFSDICADVFPFY